MEAASFDAAYPAIPEPAQVCALGVCWLGWSAGRSLDASRGGTGAQLCGCCSWRGTSQTSNRC
eukprot:355426-Chlamydomonas_euryale.AAC.2